MPLVSTSASPAGRTVLSRLALVGAAVTVLAGGLAACSSGSSDPEVDGRSFVSTSVDGHELVDGTSIQLDFADGQVSATAGCNTLFGRVTWEAGTLETDTLASTRMACEESLMEQDTWLSELLSGSPGYELTDSALILRTSSTTLTFAQS